MRILAIILALGMIQQVDNLPPELPPIPAPETLLGIAGFPIPAERELEVAVGETVYIDVLVALASGVATSNCQTGINRINTTASNSEVATVQTRMVKCLPTTYISSGSIETDQSRLYSRTDGYLDNVHVERDLAYADTVVLLSKSSNACGYAFIKSFASSAFATVYDACIGGSSFEHEWGHNIGMAHDLPNAGTPAYFYGVGWCFGNGFKDVMTYPSPCGGTRAPFYSNPDIIYQGKPTGTTTANNARVLRERAATVAAFRIRPDVTNHLR